MMDEREEHETSLVTLVITTWKTDMRVRHRFVLNRSGYLRTYIWIVSLVYLIKVQRALTSRLQSVGLAQTGGQNVCEK